MSAQIAVAPSTRARVTRISSSEINSQSTHFSAHAPALGARVENRGEGCQAGGRASLRITAVMRTRLPYAMADQGCLGGNKAVKTLRITGVHAVNVRVGGVGLEFSKAAWRAVR